MTTKRPVSYNREIRDRIRIAVAAYAYEIRDDPVMSDAEFDDIARRINPYQLTGNSRLDIFFVREFHPSTGVWIRRHPDLAGIARLYETYYRQPAAEDLI